MPCENHPEVEESLDACYGCGLPFCANCLVPLFERKYCAACKGEAVKDMHSGVEQTGHLPLAHPGRRWAAVIVDGIVTTLLFIPFILVFVALMISADSAGSDFTESPMFLVVYFLTMGMQLVIPFVYEGLMLQWKSQTLGKMALGIKVVTPMGHDLSRKEAWIRSLIRTLLGMFCILIDILPIFFTEEKTCIHDMAAKTRVVRL